jgi:NAD(P)-dependent dehydrogenase (short-subunit alcohol dehydrogenase family)
MPAADRVVIVTGAGGNLGAAVAALMAARGDRVVAVGRTEASLAGSVAEAGGPDRCLALAAPDLADPAACAGLAERTLDQFGRIDGLVNAAGAFAMADLDAADTDHWESLFHANLVTALNMCRAVVPAMRAAGRGSVVNVGAAGAARAGKGMAAYAASKSAVLRLTEGLADELKGTGVRVNCVLPGTIDTPQNRAAMPKADPARWVTTGQLAEAIAFLLADGSDGVTGAALAVTGGG